MILRENNKFIHGDITYKILSCCYEIMNVLGVGFLESVYKNSLMHALKEKGLNFEFEKTFDVFFKGQIVGTYRADIVVENCVVVELKSCKCLLPEHQAQVINYLKASEILVGLLVNFGSMPLKFRRLHNPKIKEFMHSSHDEEELLLNQIT